MQANLSTSAAGVLRGLHLHRRQLDYWVVADGRAWVALVDARPLLDGSGTRPIVETRELVADSTVTIPAGVAHGFLALEALALVYLVTAEYDDTDELGFGWDDPLAAVPWPVVPGQADGRPILSGRDRSNPSLAQLVERLARGVTPPARGTRRAAARPTPRPARRRVRCAPRCRRPHRTEPARTRLALVSWPAVARWSGAGRADRAIEAASLDGQGSPASHETGVPLRAPTGSRPHRRPAGRLRHRRALPRRAGRGSRLCRPEGRPDRRCHRVDDVLLPGIHGHGLRNRDAVLLERGEGVQPERDVVGREGRDAGREHRRLHGPRERLSQPVPLDALARSTGRSRAQRRRRPGRQQQPLLR